MSGVTFNMAAPVFSGKIEDWSIFREQVMNYFTHCKLLYTIDPKNPLVLAREPDHDVKKEGNEDKKEDVVKQVSKVLDDKYAAYCILYNSITSGGNKSVISNITFIDAVPVKKDDLKDDDAAVNSSRVAIRGDPKSLWDVLVGMYTVEKTAQAYKFGELNKLLNDRLQSNEAVTDFANRLRNHQRKLAAMGNKVPDDTLVYHLLKGLEGQPKFDSVKDALLLDGSDKPFDQVVARLKTFEETKASYKKAVVDLTTSGEQANYIKGKFRPGRGGRGGGHGNFRSRPFKCFNCDKPGHKAADCTERKKEAGGDFYANSSGQSRPPFKSSSSNRFHQQGSRRGRGGPRFYKNKGKSMYSYTEEGSDLESEVDADHERSHYSYYTGQGGNTEERRHRC
jgi:hypothetical protein